MWLADAAEVVFILGTRSSSAAIPNVLRSVARISSALFWMIRRKGQKVAPGSRWEAGGSGAGGKSSRPTAPVESGLRTHHCVYCGSKVLIKKVVRDSCRFSKQLHCRVVASPLPQSFVLCLLSRKS